MASLPFDASAINFRSGSAFTSAAMPFRKRGWSSTVRIRIKLSALVTPSHLEERFRSVMRACVSYGGRNCELNFCTGSHLAPKVQSGSNSFSALAHAAQSPVSSDPASREHMGINPPAVVTNPEPEVPGDRIVSPPQFESPGRGEKRSSKFRA